MLDVQNPDIKVDEIMQRIQEKVRLRREQAAPPQAGATVPPDSSIAFNQLLAQARDLAQVGSNLPPMSKMQGVKRRIVEPMAKAFLRIAQLITRDQRAFNNSVIASLQAFDERLTQAAATSAQASATSAQASARTTTRLEEIAARITQRIDQLEAGFRASETEAAGARRAQVLKADQLRTAVSLQERRLSLLLEEARRRLPKPLDGDQLQAFADQLPRVSDAGYLSFEDAFRGSREEIKERVSIYVAKLRAAGAGTDQAPILDIGCGRGELLEVLREQGLKASGVDDNAAAVEKCREARLEVAHGDAFEALARLPDGSLGGLTALHVVEHLPFPLVIRLLDEALRVLRPGGIAIFETPNPTNLLVGAANFYIDPTHRNPVHPQTLQYLFEARGLVQVEPMMLHPFPSEMLLPETDSPAARFINQHFFGPQDYAVAGRRP
jgi:SAM-dependent methyltransferase